MAERDLITKELFGSKTAKVMALFVANPHGKFYQSQVAAILKEPITSLQHQLGKLAKIGFVSAKQNNYKTTYSLNLNFPFYAELKLMVNNLTAPYMGLETQETSKTKKAVKVRKPKKRVVVKRVVRKPARRPVVRKAVSISSPAPVAKASSKPTKKFEAKDIFKGLFD